MLTRQDKKELIEILNQIDVKKMDLSHAEANNVKWFRFGTYNALNIVTDIISQLPEQKPTKNKEQVS